MVDNLLSTRIGYATRTALESYTKEFEKKAQEERKLYIDIVDKSIKDIIKDEVKSLLPQILPKEVSEFATPVIHTASLTEFELKKILLDKLEKSKSYRAAEDHRNLYDVLIKSYQLGKDLFDSYGKTYSLKRSREDKDKDEDPPAGSDQRLKKKKTSKDAKPPKGSKSKESKTSSSKDIEIPQDQGGDTKDQPNVEETPMDDWFKKLNKPPTPNRSWNDGKSMHSRPPQKWISNVAKPRQPPRTFDELMSTPIEFSTYVMHNLKIGNLTQEIMVGPSFNLIKGTCKSFVELEYHFKECYKAVTDQLDWNNPEGHEYPFNFSKPLPLIEAQSRQVVPAGYFFNNDLEYLKGGSSSRKYTTSTTKTKAAKIIVVTYVNVVKKYDYGYLDEIIVLREDHKLYKFKEGDFPRLNLHDLEDMLLFLVQKKLSNLERDDLF
ncbi:hypothetical protein Tco_0812529, partial [Tanacetum coccineum]